MSQKNTFTSTLLELKTAIDTEVEMHAKLLAQDAQKNYTPFSYSVVDAYNQVLLRGGKRIRGALTLVGYEMYGGTDKAMILQAAAAIEMLHAYVLVLDDIMDKSSTRRGGDSAHVIMKKYHANHRLAGNAVHFGEAEAINGAFVGAHYAQAVIARLNVKDSYKLKALQLVNDALVTTGHGQMNDIYNEASVTLEPAAVDNVLEWKTAHYTFLNPLQFGMALAGADKSTLASLYDYSMHAGRAFQITDDILGTFASEQETGKNPIDDTREGKRTIIAIAALQHADRADKNFLVSVLGNEHITQAEFARVKEIYLETGALKIAQDKAHYHIQKAVSSIDEHTASFNTFGYEFLQQLVKGLADRTS